MKDVFKKYLKNYPKIYSAIRKLYYIMLEIRRYLRACFSVLFFLIPIKQNKIVICSYYGKGYGDNGKYIVERIINKGLDYDIVWLLNKDLMKKNSLPTQVRAVKYGSLRGLYELATAKVWIDNCRKEFYSIKRKGQFYIQTWHGGIALKRIEKDVQEKLSADYIRMAKKDSKMADLFISNSRFCTEMYRRAFWYEGRILECGSPRNDILLSSDTHVKEKVRGYFDLDENTKILIYAPTFRADYSVDAYKLNFNELIKVVEKKIGGKWCVLVRLHPNVSYKSNFINYNSKVMNATHYEDMYELLAVSDILITDYSSTMFEFSLTYKPVFLYAPDIESYKKDRNFYFDIFALPFPVAEDQQQLHMQIENFDQESYSMRLKDFFEQLGILEKGNASDKVVEEIMKVISC